MANDTPKRVWVKSSLSDANGGHCVEMSPEGTAMLVRDSKHPDQGNLAINGAAWSVFLADARRGKFDL